jgi:biuret amidohydrolase
MSSSLAVPAFGSVDARPYAWPFDGQWSADDSALLLLGLQQCAVDALQAREAVLAARQLLLLAHQCGMAIVAARREAPDVALPQDAVLAPGELPVPPATWQWARDIALPDDAMIVTHAGDNAFYRTGLEAALRAAGIRNLLIAGLPTDGLVHATQRAANDMGFECLAIADACAGTTPARHDAQLRITTFGNGLFGGVADLAAVRAALNPA